MPTITFSGNYNVPADNALCLEFANTVDWRIGGESKDLLPDYIALLAWAATRGVIDAADQAYLADEARNHPDLAQAVHGRALVLREATARIFACTSRGRAVVASDIALLNAELAPAMSAMTLLPTNDEASGFALVCNEDMRTFDKMLRPIALSAAELLTSPSLDRVRQCADDEGNGCGFFFIDISRNKSRRWCSMESCGNRAKARRHYKKSLIADAQ